MFKKKAYAEYTHVLVIDDEREGVDGFVKAIFEEFGIKAKFFKTDNDTSVLVFDCDAIRYGRITVRLLSDNIEIEKLFRCQ